MRDLLLAAALLGAAAAGYLLGRVRPLDRLDTWVWRQLTFGGPWCSSKPRQAVVLAAHALVRPAVTWDIWRHRNDPKPPERSTAIRINRANRPAADASPEGDDRP